MYGKNHGFQLKSKGKIFGGKIGQLFFLLHFDKILYFHLFFWKILSCRQVCGFLLSSSPIDAKQDPGFFYKE